MQRRPATTRVRVLEQPAIMPAAVGLALLATLILLVVIVIPR